MKVNVEYYVNNGLNNKNNMMRRAWN